MSWWVWLGETLISLVEQCLMWPHCITILFLREACCSQISVLETMCRWSDELNLLLIGPDVCKLCCHNTFWPLTFANSTPLHLLLIRAKNHTTHLSTSRSQNAQVSNKIQSEYHEADWFWLCCQPAEEETNMARY